MVVRRHELAIDRRPLELILRGADTFLIRRRRDRRRAVRRGTDSALVEVAMGSRGGGLFTRALIAFVVPCAVIPSAVVPTPSCADDLGGTDEI
jgi:hypothetical protein